MKWQKNKGFTLVEMLVSVAIFTVVVLIIIGALLSINEANHKSQVVRAVIDNLNLAVESMSRKIRSGSRYHCGVGGVISSPQDCPLLTSSGDSYFAFEPFGGDVNDASDQIIYKLENHQIKVKDPRLDPNNFLSLTAPEIQVDELIFYVEGSDSADQTQPRALIVLKGTAVLKNKVVTDFNIQTNVSQRLLDVAGN